MLDDIVMNKSQIINHCIDRIREVYNDDPDSLADYTRQDSIILNIQRLCEAAIDIAVHIIRIKGYPLPQSSRECFEILCNEGLIDENLSASLSAMVGFRNIAVHDYQKLSMGIIVSIIDKHLSDPQKLAAAVAALP